MKPDIFSASFCLQASEGYFTRVVGVLSASWLDNDKTKDIGTLETWIVRIGEMQNANVGPSSNDARGWVGLVDTVACEEMMAFVCKGNDIRPSIMRQIGEDAMGCGSVHILESMEIDEKMRGHNLGLFFMHQYIQCIAMINPADVVVAHPAPITSPSEAVRKQVAAKLRAHWGKLGLKPLRGSEYSAMASCNLVGDDSQQWIIGESADKRTAKTAR